jgi:drug/metabolite transporter (DMT)-like permease
MLGVAVLSRPPFLFGGSEPWNRTQAIGTAASVASAVLGSGSSLTIRLIGNKEPAAVIAMW